jgi:hypothetical protein
MADLRAIARRSLPIEGLQRMAMTRLDNAGSAISIIITGIPSGDRTKSRNVLTAGHLVHGTVGDDHRRELRRFTNGQIYWTRWRKGLLVAMPCGRKQPPYCSMRSRQMHSECGERRLYGILRSTEFHRFGVRARRTRRAIGTLSMCRL